MRMRMGVLVWYLQLWSRPCYLGDYRTPRRGDVTPVTPALLAGQPAARRGKGDLGSARCLLVHVYTTRPCALSPWLLRLLRGSRT